MGKQLSHRGPDFSGKYISNNLLLGHERLSILDLSKNANQPLKSSNSKSIISFNGEIYNFLELINEFRLKKNSGDTKVLVEILNKFGIRALDKLRGMFAFAFHNTLNETTYLVRDRFGIKPLYYFQQSNYLFFASEIKPLLKVSQNISPNEKIINDYLNNSLIDHSRETFFKRIYQLEPGSYLKVNKKGQIIKKYKWYNLKSKIQVTKNKNDDVVRNFYEIFRETIKIHLRSDVKVGLALSGGIDSKIILDELLNSKNKRKLSSYSFCFNEKKYSEENSIKENIGKYKFNSFLLNQKQSIIDDLRKNIVMQEQPFWWCSYYRYE